MVSAQQSTGFVCFFPCVYSERGPRMRWHHSKNPSNKETVLKECTANSAEKFAVNSRDMFTTHIEVIVSWWSWKCSSRAPKIEYSVSAAPHPRRIVSVLCSSMQEGVLWNLPRSGKPETCGAYSLRENITNKFSCASEGDSGHLMPCSVYELSALSILPCCLVLTSGIVAEKNCWYCNRS